MDLGLAGLLTCHDDNDDADEHEKTDGNHLKVNRGGSLKLRFEELLNFDNAFAPKVSHQLTGFNLFSLRRSHCLAEDYNSACQLIGTPSPNY